MQSMNSLSTAGPSDQEDLYFDLMAELDFTKHLGGMDATQALAAACHIGPESVVLDVGCGVGVTPCKLARNPGCRVIGIDIRPRIIERAQARAAPTAVGTCPSPPAGWPGRRPAPSMAARLSPGSVVSPTSHPPFAALAHHLVGLHV